MYKCKKLDKIIKLKLNERNQKKLQKNYVE